MAVLFQGSVKNLAGEFRTYQELITTALDARTFDADDGANDIVLRNEAKSRVRSTIAANVFTNPQSDIYVMDAHRKGGIVAGVTQQAKWVAADFTKAPGGGELLTQGKLNPGDSGYVRFEMGNRIIYSAADATIYLDVTVI